MSVFGQAEVGRHVAIRIARDIGHAAPAGLRHRRWDARVLPI
jgi:hypothetical protein